MQLPKIDLASLPSLDTVTGMFGSLASGGSPGSDDTVIILMTYLYEILPTDGLI